MNRRSLLKSAVLALAARGLPLPSWTAAAQAQDKKMAPRPVAVRRPEISARLQAIRLRQRQRAERRRGARDRHRHLRQFQSRDRRRQRQPRRQRRADLRHAVDVVARRSVDRIRAACRKRQLPGRFFLGLLPAARRSEVARRHAGDARGRDFFLHGVQEKQPVLFRLLPACRQSREDRRSRGHLHLRRSRQPRAAADRRRAHRPAQNLVGRHRQKRQEARHRRNHARAAARQRRLPHQGLLARPHHRLRTRQGLLGQGSQRQYRPQ